MLPLTVGRDVSVASTPTPCLEIVLFVIVAGEVPPTWTPTEPFCSTVLWVRLPADAPSNVMPTVRFPENVDSRSLGAELSPGIVLVLGVANLVADGFSMAASNYVGTRTEHDELRYWEAVEHRHIDTTPEGEREQVRQIFRQKGLTGDDLERVVTAITADRARWVRTMLAEEYGLPPQVRSPWRAALSTFRCCDTAGCETGRARASSATERGRSATSSRARRRVGSAIAERAVTSAIAYDKHTLMA